MISANSNCSRIDAVKARAAQLEMWVTQAAHTKAAKDTYHKAQSEIQALNSAIKSGDARKAETALSSVSSTVRQLQSQAAPADASGRRLDAYA